MTYNDLVLSLFFNPVHAWVDNQPAMDKMAQFVDATGHQRIDFYVDYGPTGTLRTIRYKVQGNPYLIAAAEWMAQAVEKNENGAILMNMTPQYWADLFAIPKLQKHTAVILSQAANVFYKLIENR
ncbi:hypothetical protein [Legionella sp. W05-934-2]|jgi:NifU-like protein involved in Fe-S cluster formation|uniref:hypothetical protein n=1 Tax=Legionella sp. W05-934-2 TaxID=1198649 RepID=UPI003461ED6B